MATKKADLEGELRVSEDRTREVKLMMVELQKEAEEAEKVIVRLNQKAFESVNGSTGAVVTIGVDWTYRSHGSLPLHVCMFVFLLAC
ncbi:hypothetical protein LINPERHAP1_LOCUS16876 [Linum perenne]